MGMNAVAGFYGCRSNGRGLCICPFHSDKHPSMKIYPHNKGYYCFSCGSGGDVITFVGKLYGLDNEAAAKKIIEDFALPIRTDRISYAELRKREKQVKKREGQDKFVRYAQRILSEYRKLLCEAINSESKDDRFSEALQMLSIVEYRLQCLKEHPEEYMKDRKAVEKLGAIERRTAKWNAGIKEGTAVFR